MMNKRLLHSALIVNEGRSFIGYIGIKGDRIAHIGSGNVPERVLMEYSDGEIEDLTDRWILPGVIDDQVHFREPGGEHKADISTESAAAAAGGVTSYMDMPNTTPQTVSIAAWEDKMKRGADKSLVNYSFFLGATNDNFGELEKRDKRLVPGIKVFLGSSTGNMLVDNENALDRIFSLDSIIAVHSEDENIIKKNADEWREKFKGREVPVSEHPMIRSREACLKSTERAIKRALRLNTRLHLFHLSTAEEAEMLREVRGKSRITGEVCVHHLWFSDKDYERLGTKIKCNPAIKTEEDREALRSALRDGTITLVATDHAPHLLGEKDGGALSAASGLPLVQFSLSAMLHIAEKGEWSKEDVVSWMSHRPAELYRIKQRGFLRPGYYADLAVINPEKEYKVTSEKIYSRCGWSPFEGHVFPMTVESTYVNGLPVLHNGVLNTEVRGMNLEFD